MAIPVKLEVFEGPLDLLLHLIEKNKVDIYDIPIVEITAQYLDYIRAMEREDMNIMSEFLVMAATLLSIKCRMLLPKQKNEDGEEEDPRAELVQKLLEHKMYKYMAFELKDRYVDAGKSMYKAPSMPEAVLNYREPTDYEALVRDLNLMKLGEIYREMLKRVEDRVDPIRSKFGNITKDEVSVENKQNEILKYLNEHEICSFRELLNGQVRRIDIIVSFLVVLELMKLGQIVIRQDALFDDILIERAEDVSAMELDESFAIM
ncbi:MAG: segregation/condensation protein A [Lachnospiraceae bacterium]|nr:segregation/condensation protein A [Lachnospiraceae bacterium]